MQKPSRRFRGPRVIFRVLPYANRRHPNAKWAMTRNGVIRRVFRRLDEAVVFTASAARACAWRKRNPQKAELMIHTQLGRFRDERTYRDDPYPPKG